MLKGVACIQGEALVCQEWQQQGFTPVLSPLAMSAAPRTFRSFHLYLEHPSEWHQPVACPAGVCQAH